MKVDHLLSYCLWRVCNRPDHTVRRQKHVKTYMVLPSEPFNQQERIKLPANFKLVQNTKNKSKVEMADSSVNVSLWRTLFGSISGPAAKELLSQQRRSHSLTTRGLGARRGAGLPPATCLAMLVTALLSRIKDNKTCEHNFITHRIHVWILWVMKDTDRFR